MNLWKKWFPPDPTEKICPQNGYICKISVCNGRNNTYCENLAVLKEIRDQKLCSSK